jgi:hypothetical protein
MHACLASASKSLQAVFAQKSERSWSSPRLMVFRLVYGLKSRSRQGKCDWKEAKRYTDDLVVSLQQECELAAGNGKATGGRLSEALSLRAFVNAQFLGDLRDKIDVLRWPEWASAAIDGDWWSMFWLARLKGVSDKRWSNRLAFLEEVLHNRREPQLDSLKWSRCSTRCLHDFGMGAPERRPSNVFCLYDELLKRAHGRHGCPVAQYWAARLYPQNFGHLGGSVFPWPSDEQLQSLESLTRASIRQGNWATVTYVIQGDRLVKPQARDLHRRDRLLLGSKLVPRWREGSKCALSYYEKAAMAPVGLSPRAVAVLNGFTQLDLAASGYGVTYFA